MSELEFDQEEWEVEEKFIRGYDNSMGPFTWNLTEAKLNINPKVDGTDADQVGIIMNGDDDIIIRSSKTDIKIPLNSFIVDNNTLNPMGTMQASSTITPITTLLPNDADTLLLMAMINAVGGFLEDIKDEKQSPVETKYEYEIIDYDDFLPN